jgi:spore germination protein PE
MMYRTSVVDCIILNSLANSGVLQTGDTDKINSFSAALAIQRESTKFGTFNVPYSKYKVFSQPVLVPVCPVYKVKQTYHANPYIRVGKIDILGVSSSSILHIGSVNDIKLQSRVKHIRNFFTNPYPESEEEET